MRELYRRAAATSLWVLNLSPEEADSVTAYRKSEERLRMEQQSKREPVDRKDGEVR